MLLVDWFPWNSVASPSRYVISVVHQPKVTALYYLDSVCNILNVTHSELSSGLVTLGYRCGSEKPLAQCVAPQGLVDLHDSRFTVDAC